MIEQLRNRQFHIRKNYLGLGVILLIFTCLALTYSLVLPLGESADATDHFALIRFIAETNRPPLTVAERQAIGTKGDASPFYHGLVTLLTQHMDVSSLPKLPLIREEPRRSIPSDGLSIETLLHTEDEAFPFRGIVLAWHLARSVSIPLGLATIVAIYITVLTIYPTRLFFALAVASFAAFIPRFVTNSAIVNDDNLVVPLIAFSIYCLVRVTQGDTRRSTFITLGVLMGLAALAKYHSLVLLLEMTLVLIVVAQRDRWGWRTWLRRWSWTIMAFTLTASWWFGFLLVQFNQVAELGWVHGMIAPFGDPVMTTGLGHIADLQPVKSLNDNFGWFDWASQTFRTFWVSYGSRRVLATPPVYWGLGGIMLLAIFGLARGGWQYLGDKIARQDKVWRLDILLLAFHLLVYLSLVVMRFMLTPTEVMAQGRHLFPALTAIAFFFVRGLFHLLPLPTPARDRVLAIAIAGSLIALSALTPFLFIRPAYFPYLPIVTAGPEDVDISHRLEGHFAEGMNFVGYDMAASVRMGEALPLTLYWHVDASQEQDYLIRVCLQNHKGQVVTCHYGYPANGRYPMRAWEVGYLIRDEVYLPTPACLPAGNYQLILSVLPLHFDKTSTTINEAVAAWAPFSLGSVSLLAPEQPPLDTFVVWTQNKRYTTGEMRLKQLRQALTVISYGTKGENVDELSFKSAGIGVTDDVDWPTVVPPLTVQCAEGRVAAVYNYVVDAGVRPDFYRLRWRGQPENTLQVQVATRRRNYHQPDNIPTKVRASFADEVELVGYEVDLWPRRTGDTIDISTFWRGLRTMSRPYVVTLYLLDHLLAAQKQMDGLLVHSYFNVLWAPGEAVNEVYRLPIDPKIQPGLYTIQFSMYYHDTSGKLEFLPVTTAVNPEPGDRLYLGQIRILDPAHAQSPSQLLTVELGEQIQLLGFDLSSEQLSRTKPLHLTLYWQSIDHPTTNYTVFTQLIGPDGQVWGQQDNQPQGGRYPTTAWVIQDRVADRYELFLREAAPAGQYRLLVGMYDLATGQRLPAINGGGNRLSNDAILLDTLILE